MRTLIADLQVPVAVEDVVGAAAFEGVAAETAEEDVAVAPDRAGRAGRRPIAESRLDGAGGVVGVGRRASRPAIRSMPVLVEDVAAAEAGTTDGAAARRRRPGSRR